MEINPEICLTLMSPTKIKIYCLWHNFLGVFEKSLEIPYGKMPPIMWTNHDCTIMLFIKRFH